ncbi:unnamed protein product [Durusdinium trenchii]
MCLAGTAMVLVVLRFLLALCVNQDVMKDFQKQQEPAGQEILDNTAMKVGIPIIGLLFACVIPCCGYFGAKNNNSTAVCFFAYCNCCFGFIQTLAAILCVVGIVAMSVLSEQCKPGVATDPQVQETCANVLNSCKYMKSDHFDLQNYDGCYDHMSEQFSFAIGILSVILAINCCTCCLACASCWWGRELHTSMQFNDICMDSSDDDV